MRKRVFLVVGLLVGLMALAAVGSVGMAQEVADSNDDSAKSKSGYYNDFIARVAEILDVDEDDLVEAIEIARDEAHEAWLEEQQEKLDEWKAEHREKLEERLDHYVESGKITQDEADDYLEHFDEKSDGSWLGYGFKRGHHHSFGWHRGYRDK